MRSSWKLGVGFVWAVGGAVALGSLAAIVDDPMDPAYQVPKAQGRQAVAFSYEGPAAPIRQGGMAAVSLKSLPSDIAFSTPFTAPVGGDPRAVAVGDFDGDGLEDVAVANRTTNDVSVLLASGPGTFLSSRQFAAGAEPRSIAAGDLNGDGYSDLVVANRASINLSVLRADGSGGFAPTATANVSEQPGALALADLNGDGRLDVVVTFPESDKVAVLLGRGNGTFAANTQYPTGRAPVSVAVADFDQDGLLDVVTANRTTNDVSVLRGLGNGSLATRRGFAAGTGPFHVTVADMNSDGVADLAVADFDGNTLALLRGDGHGAFGAPTLHPTGLGPASTASADFNADGSMDLALVTFTDGTLMVFAGDGAGVVSAPVTFAAGAGARTLAASDLDDDGRVDLVAALRDESLAAWFLNDGPFPAEDEPALPPTAVAGADKTMECTSAEGAVVRLDGTASFAAEGDLARFEWLDAGGEPLAEGALVDVVLPLGATLMTLRVTDAAGEVATDSLEVVVSDTTAPSLEFTLDPSLLSPANHSMAAVGATVVASDACGAVTTELFAVTSSQPDDAPGSGDGTTTNDIQETTLGTADYAFLLRAERDGGDPAGRTYDVTYRVSDGSGNVSDATRSVFVPHDQGADDPGPADGDDDDNDDDRDQADGDDDDDDDDDRGRRRGRGRGDDRDHGGDDDDDDE